MGGLDPRIRRLFFETDSQYGRDYVLFMTHKISEQAGLPEQFVKEFAFLALWQQMCCVTIEGVGDWVTKWDDLLKRYKNHLAVRIFVSETEELFMEGLTFEDIKDESGKDGKQRR